MISTNTILALTLALPAAIRGTQYGLVKEYAGSSFFDEWNFYGHCELQIVSVIVSLPLKRHMFQMTTLLMATPSKLRARPVRPSDSVLTIVCLQSRFFPPHTLQLRDRVGSL